ncbi:MAG: ABC transporter substrate-binding protein [Alphaproteobacteria bacterium]|nr:ABC transporter substrate-binding protein [Alphaproteobacteria bacterium]
MKSNLFLRVISVLFFLFGISEAMAIPVSSEDAVLWAKKNGQHLMDTFREKDFVKKYNELDAIFDQYIDSEYVAKFVVGKYWRMMNKEQQSRYVSIFNRYVKALYKTFPLDFVNRLKYEVKTAFIDGNFTVVNVIVNMNIDSDAPLKEYLLSFRLHQTAKGIQLVDIKVGESSLLLSYRRKFYEQIISLEEEIEWFLEDLEDMAKSAERKNQAKMNQY